MCIRDSNKISHAVVNEPLVPLADVIDVGAVSDGLADLVEKMLEKSVSRRVGTAKELGSMLESVLSHSADTCFDLFISYRVWCEQQFADPFFKKLSSIRLNGQRLMIYLDKVRLLDGQRFDVGFVQGLASSSVFCPLISANCLAGFLDITATNDKEDFVLLEWIMALELMKQGVIKAIFPIIIGDQRPDGSYGEGFFQELRTGKVNGQPLPDLSLIHI